MSKAALFMLTAVVLSLYVAPLSAAEANETLQSNQTAGSNTAVGYVYVTLLEPEPKYELFGIGLVTGDQFDFGEFFGGLQKGISELLGLA